MRLQTSLSAATAAVIAVFRHADLAGYRMLDWRDKSRLNLLAAGRLLCSVTALHMGAALTVWMLTGYLLVWALDWRGVAVHVPLPAALTWWLPWLAAVRRRELRRILGRHPGWRHGNNEPV